MMQECFLLNRDLTKDYVRVFTLRVTTVLLNYLLVTTNMVIG